MRLSIASVDDLGRAVRAVRRHSRVRIDDFAALAQVSKQFVSDVEHGKSTVRLGLVLRLLQELGIDMSVDVPDAVRDDLAAVQRSAANE